MSSAHSMDARKCVHAQNAKLALATECDPLPYKLATIPKKKVR